MYNSYDINELSLQAETAAKAKLVRHGVNVYVECDPDYAGADIYIDPRDTVGIEIFREFASKMAAHYKSIQQ